MDIYALNSDFQLVTTGIPYENLQWTRRYYDAGQFAMQIPIELYNNRWSYIGTSARPELGMAQKMLKVDNDHVQVSGFFCEAMLNEKACYPRYIGDVQHTEQAVKNIFEMYKGDLPIIWGETNEPLLGDRTQSDFSDDALGDKLFRILESRELSYRVRYDYIGNQLYMEVWHGLDRTQSQNVNPCQTFSYEFGNILKDTIDKDNSAWKNYAIIPVNADDNGKEQDTFYLDLSNGERHREKVFDMRSSKPEDGQSYASFKAAIIQEVMEKMVPYAKIEDIDVDVVGQIGYMKSYDLGDKCDLILTDVNMSLESRIVEVAEVIKESGHTVTVGLGNKRFTRKAVL